MNKINTLSMIFVLALSFGCKSDKGGSSGKTEAPGVIASNLVYKKNIPAPVVTNVNNAVYTSKEVKINWTSSNSKFLVRVDDVTNANVPVRLYTSDNHLTKDHKVKVADNRKYKIWVHAASSVQFSQDYGDAVYHYFSTGKLSEVIADNVDIPVLKPVRIAAPTGLSKSDAFVSAIDGKKYIKISWKAPAGAVGYLVRAAYVGSTTNLVEKNDIVALSYDLEVTSGKNYKFWLHSFDKNFNTTSGYNDKNYSEEANLIVNVTSDNTCTANSTSTCVIANGSGSQTSICTNGVLAAPSKCMVSSCNAGFEKSILNNNCAEAVVSGAPVIDSPTAGQVVETSGDIVVRWQALSGALSYDYCYAVKNQQSTQKCFSNINQNYATIIVDSGKIYDFWISAKKANNIISDVRILTFSTKQANCAIAKVLAQVFSCPIANGTGSQTAICTSDGSVGRSRCVAVNCNSGYKLENGACSTVGPISTITAADLAPPVSIAHNMQPRGTNLVYRHPQVEGGKEVVFGKLTVDVKTSSYYATGNNVYDPKIENSNYLIYNTTIDGYGGRNYGVCIKIGDCPGAESLDLFKIALTYDDVIRNMLIKNVVIKNAFVVHEGPHTDLFQSVTYGLRPSGYNVGDWLVMQDTVMKNSDHNTFTWSGENFKGMVLHNVVVLPGYLDSAFDRDCKQRLLYNKGPHCYGHQTISAGTAFKNRAGPQETWIINSRVADRDSVTIPSVNGSRYISSLGKVILIGARSKNMVVNTDYLLPQTGPYTAWETLPRTDEPDNKVFRYDYIEDAIAAHERPPFLELSCSGWRVPPAGCVNGIGPK